MKPYKTPESLRQKLKARRDAIKSAGGAEYEALLRREREQKQARRALLGRAAYDKSTRKTFPFRTYLCAEARARGRRKGLEATITAADLDWPTHCPILGIELDYPERSGERKDRTSKPNWPSLDRWDNSKGYVPGNVFVISHRANSLKSSGNIDEMMKILAYMREPPSVRCSEAVSG